MPEENQMVDLLKYLYGKRKQILLWTGTAALLSVVFSLLMPNYYKAATTFYASAQSLSNPESIFGSQDGQMYFFGGDSDTDRLLAIGKSREVSEFIIEKYNLVDHYEVDTSTLRGKERLMLKFSNRLEILKNKFDAIELSFEDTDRTLVDDVANDCREKINEIARRVVRENQVRMIEVCQENIYKNQSKLATVEDSISSITVIMALSMPNLRGSRSLIYWYLPKPVSAIILRVTITFAEMLLNLCRIPCNSSGRPWKD